MGGYARNAFAGMLMVGLLAVPSLSPATDGKGHSLIQHPNKHAVEHHQHNQGGLAHYIEAMQLEIITLKNNLTTANKDLKNLADRLKALETGTGTTPSTSPALADLAKYVKIEPGVVNGLKGPHVIFYGVNLHVESGSGMTVEAAPTGLGNLIVGYNEMPMPTGGSRVGSHNLVVGPSNAFTSTGGAVFGSNNLISGPSATILGGKLNASTGLGASILGGTGVVVNDAEATYP